MYSGVQSLSASLNAISVWDVGVKKLYIKGHKHSFRLHCAKSL